jgi:hypothetical protein
MLSLRAIIESEKSVDDYGQWRFGSIPKASFPLRKKRMQQSSEWAWRIVTFTALSNEFIVLVRLNTQIQEYYAYLAHMRADGMAVICSHDLHVSHKNWHCHFVKGDTGKTDAGYLRDKYNMIQFPSGGSEVECSVEFEITTANALLIAARRFRFEEPNQSELEL